MKTIPLTYRVGHPSYQGANGSPVVVNSKRKAVAELRRRGCTRDTARLAVNAAERGSHAFARAHGEGVEIIAWDYWGAL